MIDNDTISSLARIVPGPDICFGIAVDVRVTRTILSCCYYNNIKKKKNGKNCTKKEIKGANPLIKMKNT